MTLIFSIFGKLEKSIILKKVGISTFKEMITALSCFLTYFYFA